MQIYFAWKQLNVDYSKNISKEENRWHSFVWLCLATYQRIKVIENCNSVGTGAHKLGKVATFCPTLTLILERLKKVNYILWKRLVLVHLRRCYKNMYIVALSCFINNFYFARKVLQDQIAVKLGSKLDQKLTAFITLWAPAPRELQSSITFYHNNLICSQLRDKQYCARNFLLFKYFLINKCFHAKYASQNSSSYCNKEINNSLLGKTWPLFCAAVC